MTLGEKLSLLRKESGMSQEKLAETLGVSRQSVYKWEAGESFPDREKIDKLVAIFYVNYDFLLNDSIDYKDREKVAPRPAVVEEAKEEEKKEEPKEEPKQEKEAPEEKEIEEPARVAKRPLGVCSKCGKTIFEESDLVFHPASYAGGDEMSMAMPAYSNCRSCEDKLNLSKKRNELWELKRRKNRAITVGIIATVIVAIIAILALVLTKTYEAWAIVIAVVAILLSFPTGFSVIMDNTFAGEMWIDVSLWGFKRMPGVIFSLSFEGIVFLIITKIVLSIFAIMLAVGAMILASLLCMLLSPISFPLSISRYKKDSVNLDNELKAMSGKK